MVLVRRLLELDVDVNVQGETPRAQSAILHAAETGSVEIARLLLDAGADGRALSRSGESTLLLAAETGNVALGELLIAAGADPHFATPVRRMGSGDRTVETGGRTALMAAAAEGHLAFVQWLISQGVDVNAAMTTGYTALRGAERGRHTEVADVLRAAGARR